MTVLSGAIEVVTLFGYLYFSSAFTGFQVLRYKSGSSDRESGSFLKLSLPTTFNFLAWAGCTVILPRDRGHRKSIFGCAVMTAESAISLKH
ncbi:hypothetical protein O9929_18490 [Vibrio lentus]|nr:hypothetical protein [Vibrio lentus]